MRRTTLAASAALVVFARIASAQTEGTEGPADDAGVRAAAEARAILATMQTNAHVALDALMAARARKQREEIRCADEALSRADVALRRSREDLDALQQAARAHSTGAVKSTLDRLRLRAAASHAAAVMAATCEPGQISPASETTVVVTIDPQIAPVAL
jgi:hypothetical protein